MTGLVEVAPCVWLRRRSVERIALAQHMAFVRGDGDTFILFGVTRSSQ